MDTHERTIHVEESPIRATYDYVEASALGETGHSLRLINSTGKQIYIIREGTCYNIAKAFLLPINIEVTIHNKGK